MEPGDSGPPAPSSGGVSISQDERTHAILTWILMLLPCVGWIVPIVFYVIDKDKPFAQRHAAQALTLIITAVVTSIALYVLTIVSVFIFAPLAILFVIAMWGVGLFSLVVLIIGTIKASNSEPYDPPLTSVICKSMFKV